jgi:uncharacterized hydrophobic protein (TIGR00271 family)
MFQVRVFGELAAMESVAERLSELPDARHEALAALDDLGVAPDEIALVRLDSVQPGRLRRENLVVWADLLGQAGEYARPVARYLVFMAAAGVIAAYGVIYANAILVVGAMAVSPDLLPIAAICVSIVLRRGALGRRAVITLAAGLALAALVAGLLTAAFDALGLLPSGFDFGSSLLAGLTTVNSSTFVVATVAGVAGLLALETRASSAVGVAISVTTIPASAYLGAAAGEGEVGRASGALAVLAINVACLVIGGTAALLIQRLLGERGRRRASPPRRAVRAPRAGA